MDVTTDSMRKSYSSIVRQVVKEGRKIAPRGEPTLEMSGATIRLTNPLDSLAVDTGRGIVTKLAVVETLQCIAGVDEADTLIAAAPHYAAFVGPDGTMRSTYGGRLADQMSHVEAKLREDESTRQAVATPWRHEMDAAPGEYAYPCTLTLGYFIRDNTLEAYTTMRSNDAWLGLPYDVFQFTQMQLTLARVLGILPGVYTHHAWSLHVYKRDFDKVEKLRASNTAFAPRFSGISGPSWENVQLRAGLILRGEEPTLATSSELEYLKVMREILAAM